MSDKDKEVLEGAEDLNLEIKPLGEYGQGEISFSNRDLGQEQPTQKPEMTLAEWQKRNNEAMQKKAYGENPVNTREAQQATNDRANKKLRDGY